MTNIIKGAIVSFCSVTSPHGFKNGKHLLGVYVDKKFKKQFEKDFNAVWEESKTSKAKNPVYDFKEWFSKDDKTGELIFWLNADASKERGIVFKQPKGANFSQQDFGKIGTKSEIDVSYDLYYHNHSTYGEMVLRSIKAISLVDLVPYEDDGGLDGEAVEFKKFDNEVPVKEEKKKKKGKKKKGKK